MEGDIDYEFAELGLRETEHYGQICFLAQQAAEKYLKGFLIAFKTSPKKIHSIAILAQECSKLYPDFKEFIQKGKTLDRYYTYTLSCCGFLSV